MQPDPLQDPCAPAKRPVSQGERALLARWFAGTARTGVEAIAAAYVSERSRDDPHLRNTIVIAGRHKAEITYLIHGPLAGSDWILTSGETREELGRFHTLQEALGTIRPHRPAFQPSSIISQPGEPLASTTSQR
jgi:hypothetical protein